MASISPVNASQLLESINQATNASKTTSSDFMPFKDLLNNAISAVESTDAAVKSDMAALALGETDAIHNVTIDAAKADLAIQTLVAVRNKALDAYNEIMRITL
jgi:flagellar hook-basal body complex protein FliE